MKSRKTAKKGLGSPDTILVGTAMENCKVGDIVVIKANGSGVYEVSPMKEEMEESSHSFTSSSKSSSRIDGTPSDPMLEIIWEDRVGKEEIKEESKMPKKVIAKKRRITPNKEEEEKIVEKSYTYIRNNPYP